MGFSLSWLAVHGKEAVAVRRVLGVRGTGQHEDVPDSPLLAANLPTGWFLGDKHTHRNACGFPVFGADTHP